MQISKNQRTLAHRTGNRFVWIHTLSDCTSSLRKTLVGLSEQTWRRYAQCKVLSTSHRQANNQIVASKCGNGVSWTGSRCDFQRIHHVLTDARAEHELPIESVVQRALGAHQQVMPSMRNQIQCHRWARGAGVELPENISSTFIFSTGKYETIIDDSALALHMADADKFTFPTSQRTSGTSERLREYFSKIPVAVTKSLYKLYEDDFKLFGYSLEDVLGYELG